MSEFTIADIVRGRPDSTGTMILDVYTKVEKVYAVYQTEQRVMIQFADDQALGADQRKSLTDLYITRGTINWMLDEMRATGNEHGVARTHRYARRLADSLIIGLQGQTQQAAAELESLKNDLAEESKSRNRLRYLMTAGAVALAVIAIIAVINSPLINYHEPVAQTLWYAGCIGTIGAFFSIAIAIRNRTVETGPITRDTILDAALRILVGALGGALLIALIKSGAFGLTIGTADIKESKDLLSTGSAWLLVFLVAFIAGFFERMVPDLLAKAAPKEVAAQQAPPRRPAEDSAANERNPLGNQDGKAPQPATTGPQPDGLAGADAVPALEDETDTCCDGYANGTTTDDVELPEALGGIETAEAIR